MSQTSTETLNVGDVICGLKAAVTALECQHKMEMKKQIMKAHRQKPVFPPMYMMIPIEEDKFHCEKKNEKKCVEECEKNETKSISSRSPSVNEKEKDKKRKKKHSAEEDECAFVSPEMRGGVLYAKCECLARNGLQDDCPLTLCQGQPDCLVKPWPVCPPGKYFRGQHPEVYPAPPNRNALTL